MIGVGGFLGVGEHLVAVPLDKVKFVNEPIVYTGAANAPASGGARPSTTTTGAATRRAAGASRIPGIRITPCSARPRIS